ncbi:MAG: M14 family metallocarboxypeptidase [Verrucomicrobia bacterium]|nr:M14 family metallocarboxypeptidase [Verrucomicrobiota bacterium]
MQRLGKNAGAYRGETIEIESVLGKTIAAARRHGWNVKCLEAAPGLSLCALHRASRVSPRTTHHAPRIYLSTGIHGDEPAGPLAAQRLIEEDAWPADCDFWLCPCLNPTGFPRNSRESALGHDLNRQYSQFDAPETRAHVEWLKQQPPFDLTLCLHEDWEAQGFYLYELNPSGLPTRAEAVIEAVAKVCPIDHSAEIEGRAARGGIIRPDTDPRSRPQWPESFWLLTHKSPQSYTFEAPSDFSMEVRVSALVAAANSALQFFKPAA